jgi:hypothetical protein
MLTCPSLPLHIDTTLKQIKYNIFSEPFLIQPDQLEYTKEPFPTNGDRYAAAEVNKRLNPEAFPR